MKSLFGVVVLAACILLPSPGAAASPQPAELKAEVTLSSGVVVRASLMTVAFSSVTPQIEALRWGADDGPRSQPPRFVIASMAVDVGGDRVRLPLSAFVDLCEPHILKAVRTKRGFALMLTGSDAGGAYEARFFFEAGKLVRRKVVLGEAPDNVWEETTYHSHFPIDW